MVQVRCNDKNIERLTPTMTIDDDQVTSRQRQDKVCRHVGSRWVRVTGIAGSCQAFIVCGGVTVTTDLWIICSILEFRIIHVCWERYIGTARLRLSIKFLALNVDEALCWIHKQTMDQKKSVVDSFMIVHQERSCLFIYHELISLKKW